MKIPIFHPPLFLLQLQNIVTNNKLYLQLELIKYKIKCLVQQYEQTK